MSNPTSNDVPTKSALRDLIQTALAANDGTVRKAIWARLAAAPSRMPPIVDELDRLLQTRPWPPLPLVGPVATIASTLSTLTVLGCKTPNPSRSPSPSNGYIIG